MSYRDLGEVIKRVIDWLNSNSIGYALVGGIAVSFRTIERATRDIDLIIVVESDFEAEEVVRAFQSIGFQPETLLENSVEGRIATVRLLNNSYSGVYLDLLFSSSGVEKEIARTSEEIEILDGLFVRVASIPSLISLKVLSADSRNRPRDIFDLENLLKEATDDELKEAEALLKLIQDRGYNRNKDLLKLFKKYMSTFRSL